MIPTRNSTLGSEYSVTVAPIGLRNPRVFPTFGPASLHILRFSHIATTEMIGSKINSIGIVMEGH